MNRSLSPSLDAALSDARLKSLLVSGNLGERDLNRRAQRLELLFDSAARTCPAPLWAPGLAIEREWRAVTETFLPWCEIVPSFRRLISLSLRYPPPSDPLSLVPSWPEFLDRFAPGTATANPAPLFRRLLGDESFRRSWLFLLFLPKEHGGNFGRYPAQMEFIRRWLARRPALPDNGISCLDAACGSGEGTWDLALLLRECGFGPREVAIRGSSLDPLEIFAAAHALFPHDPGRGKEYRHRIRPLFDSGFAERMTFIREDLADLAGSQVRYDLILCNGLIGGPMLHGPEQMELVVKGLVTRLRPGGLIVAADRFHEGWLRMTPRGAREAVLARCGVRVLETGEGIGGERLS